MKNIFKICILVIAICAVMYGFDYFVKNKVYIKPYNDIVKEVSNKYDVDENLIYAIIKVESKFNQNVVSSANAKGLMQIIDDTGEEMGQKIGIINFEPNMLYEPDINIELGTKYFKTLYDKYDGNITLALIAYNAGQGNLDRWISEGLVTDQQSYYNLPYNETTVYWQKVLREYNAYNTIYTSEKNIK